MCKTAYNNSKGTSVQLEYSFKLIKLAKEIIVKNRCDAGAAECAEEYSTQRSYPLFSPYNMLGQERFY